MLLAVTVCVGVWFLHRVCQETHAEVTTASLENVTKNENAISVTALRGRIITKSTFLTSLFLLKDQI